MILYGSSFGSDFVPKKRKFSLLVFHVPFHGLIVESSGVTQLREQLALIILIIIAYCAKFRAPATEARVGPRLQRAAGLGGTVGGGRSPAVTDVTAERTPDARSEATFLALAFSTALFSRRLPSAESQLLSTAGEASTRCTNEDTFAKFWGVRQAPLKDIWWPGADLSAGDPQCFVPSAHRRLTFASVHAFLPKTRL